MQITDISERVTQTPNNLPKLNIEKKSTQQSINSTSKSEYDENNELIRVENEQNNYYDDNTGIQLNNDCYSADDNLEEKIKGFSNSGVLINNHSPEYSRNDDEISGSTYEKRGNSKKYSDGIEEKPMDRSNSFRKLSYKLNGISHKRNRG